MTTVLAAMTHSVVIAPSDLVAVPVKAYQGKNQSLMHSWFVHGMLEDQHCWKDLVQILDPAQAALPHLPWSAQQGSDWGQLAEGYSWIAHFAQTQTELPRLMVAHSYGCNALIEYLLLHPSQQPAALVLLSPFYRTSRAEIAWETFRDLAMGLEDLLAESITIKDTRGRYHSWLLEEMVIRVRDRLGVYGWAEFLKLFLRSPDLRLEQLACPVLVVSGEHDSYSLSATNADLAQRLPHGEHLNIIGAGHFPHITHATQLAAAIQTFVDLLPSPTHSTL